MRKEEVRAILQLPRELLNDMQEIDDRIEEYRRTFLRSPTNSHLFRCQAETHHDLSDRMVSMEDLISAKKEAELEVLYPWPGSKRNRGGIGGRISCCISAD